MSWLLEKFKPTGIVADAPKNINRGGGNCLGESEDINSLNKLETGCSSEMYSAILKKHRFHPCKLQLLHQKMILIVELKYVIGFWKIWKRTQSFFHNLCSPMELTFMLTVKRQNLCYWFGHNPHWISSNKADGMDRFMVWCGKIKSSALNFLKELETVKLVYNVRRFINARFGQHRFTTAMFYAVRSTPLFTTIKHVID